MDDFKCDTCIHDQVCDHNKYGFENCNSFICSDLIKKQQAEIKLLKTNFNSMCVSMPHIARAERKEAIKEFAEAVKLEFYKEFDELIPSIMSDSIDDLVKGMGGAT